MNNKLLQPSLIASCLLICLAAYQTYVHIAAPQVPYMDTMRLLVQIDQILKGEISWMAIYGAGEHRGLIYPVVTLIEWVWWGVDARVTTVLTGFVVTGTFLFWLMAFWQSRKASSSGRGYLTLFILGTISALIFVSPAAFELWTLDLGFAQLIKNLLIVAFLYELAIGRFWPRSWVQSLITGLVGGFLILFCTYGWSYPFFAASTSVLFLACLSAPQNKFKALILFGVMFLAQAIYIYSGSGVFSNSTSMTETAFSIPDLIRAVLYGAGTVFIGTEVLAKLGIPLLLPMTLGLLLLLVCFVSSLLALNSKSTANNFLCGLMIFSLTVLAGVAVARGGVNFADAGASRYYVDYVWLLLAPAVIIFSVESNQGGYPFVDRLLPRSVISFTKFLMAFLFAAAVVGHAATWREELKTAPYRAVTFNNMADVYWNGVHSESDAALLQSPFPEAKGAVEVAQAYSLANLRSASSSCSVEEKDYEGQWFPSESKDARWMEKDASFFIRCPTPITIKGFIPETFSERTLRVSSGDYSETITVVPGQEFSVTLNELAGKSIGVTLSVDSVTNPAAQGLGLDSRDLGLLITYIGK